MSRKVNLEKVIEAKILSDSGKNYSQIGKELGVSGVTAQRWVTMHVDGLEEILQERRKENQEKFADKAWGIIFKGLDQLEGMVDRGELKAKELIPTIGMLADKVHAFRPKVALPPGNQQPIFNFILNQESNERISKRCDAESDTDELPSESGEIQGYDMRSGSGENLLALPGSREDCSELPEDNGCDSCINI